MNAIGRRLYEANFGPAQIATEAQVHELLRDTAKAAPDNRFKLHFLAAEWDQVVATSYPKVRGTAVPADIYDEVVSELKTFRAAKSK